MKSICKLLSLQFAILFMFSIAEAQQVSRPRAGATGTWRLLGTTQAKFTADHDVIIVAGPMTFSGN